MANRFLETNFYKSPFVRGLKGSLKALYSFIICDCTASGIWFADLEIASTYIGFPVTKEEFEEHFVKSGKAIDLGKGKFFFPDFIEHQHPKGLQEKNPAHFNIISELKKHGLLDEDFKVQINSKEAPKEGLLSPIGNGKGNGNGNVEGKDNSESEKKIEVAKPQQLTKLMVEAYKIVHPKYRENIHGDTMWCGSIAKFIAEENGWPPESITNGRMNDVLEVWKYALEKKKGNSFWYSRSLQKLSDAPTWTEFSQFIDFKPTTNGTTDKHVVGKTFIKD